MAILRRAVPAILLLLAPGPVIPVMTKGRYLKNTRKRILGILVTASDAIPRAEKKAEIKNPVKLPQKVKIDS
jgi:hypothetical protein